MSPDDVLAHCLAKPGAWQDNPWDHLYPVVKVSEQGKIFCFLGAHTCGVKAGATREVADEWLDRYPEDAAVMRYIGRSGWNELTIDAGIPEDEILDALDDSYAIVVGRLAKKHRPAGWEG